MMSNRLKILHVLLQGAVGIKCGSDDTVGIVGNDAPGLK